MENVQIAHANRMIVNASTPTVQTGTKMFVDEIDNRFYFYELLGGKHDNFRNY